MLIDYTFLPLISYTHNGDDTLRTYMYEYTYRYCAVYSCMKRMFDVVNTFPFSTVQNLRTDDPSFMGDDAVYAGL